VLSLFLLGAIAVLMASLTRFLSVRSMATG
jgi:hypothetical protein